MDVLRNMVVGLILLLSVSVIHANTDSVNINTASATVLAEMIVGVGPGKANAIIEYRQQHGPFESIQDLSKVKGIGEKTVEANKHNLTIN